MSELEERFPPARRPRRGRYDDLVEACHRMEPGDHEDFPVPTGENLRVWRERYVRAVAERVRDDIPHHWFRVTLTARRCVRVSCHYPRDRGRIRG